MASDVESLAHLRRARDRMDRDDHLALGVEEIAHAAHQSRAHFTRAFKRAYGIAPHAYLSSRRIARAKHLLLTTDMPVTEVCLAVGFRSLGSFSARFRELTGKSPTEYRSTHRGPAPRVPPCFAVALLQSSTSGEAPPSRRP